MSVLLGFANEIRAFMESSGQCNLSKATWWLHHSVKRTKTTGCASWSTDAQFLVLIEHFHAQLKRRRGCRDVYKNRTKGQLRLGQVCVLLRDLLLVASGLRPSCLVDCCALKKGVAKLLLDYLDENEASQQWFD
ncbi:unnamed protein product [Peronospora belbahrii]|uniref:Uncharacterized protein n=1 Tax=Peronospora belbahrii TaxID=622444 RepID=A0AAU9KX34_9STRA|nr:unnamed protein product [Peronospora belbahrii]